MDNIGELIESLSNEFKIEVLVDNKYLYNMKIPDSINKSKRGGPEVQHLTENLKKFASSNNTKYFMSNYTNVIEKISQLNQFDINNCEHDKLESFLLHENQYETLKDSTSMTGRLQNKGKVRLLD